MTTHPTHPGHPTTTHTRPWGPVLGGAAAAAVAALVTRAGAATGTRLTVRSGETVREVGWLSTALVAFLAAAAGLALLRFLARRAHGRAVWWGVAGLFLLVSLAGPLGATTVAAGLALLSLHLVVAAVAVRAGHWWA